jgi:hypothetical protein
MGRQKIVEILDQRPQLLVCHQSATFARTMGGGFAALGIGLFVLVTYAKGNVQGSLWVAYVAGALFAVVGGIFVVRAEDDRIVLDGAARVARIIRRGLLGQSTTEVPFASIRDVALEVAVRNQNYSSSGEHMLTFRPVFVTTDDRHVPWTPMSTSNRTPQALAVAAARRMGGWNALPIEGAPTIARAVTAATNLGCLYVFAALFALMGLFFMGLQIVPLLTWKPTTATIVTSDVGYVRSSKGGETWKPVIKYTYEVSDVPYTSYRVAPLETSASRGWAMSVSQRYQPGATVPAWYNPSRPSDAIIDRHLSLIPLFMLGFMALVVGLLVWAVKRARNMTAAALTGGDVPIVNRP